jgi:hypothetical protein
MQDDSLTENLYISNLYIENVIGYLLYWNRAN